MAQKGDVLVDANSRRLIVVLAIQDESTVLAKSASGATIPFSLQQLQPAPDFEFEVCSRRQRGNAVYRISIREAGWHIAYAEAAGDCDPTGNPVLRQLLEEANVKYPKNVGSTIQSIWQLAVLGQLTSNDIQARLESTAYEIRIMNGGTI